VEEARKELERALEDAELAYRTGAIEYEQNLITAEYTRDSAILTGQQAKEVYDETVASLQSAVTRAEEELQDAEDDIAEYESYVNDGSYKSTFVSKPKIVEDTTVFLESFSKEMATKGISVQTEVLEQRMIAANEEVASKLKVPCGDEVIKIVRLRYVKDSFHEGPIVYNISYFPKKFSFLLKCNFEEESLTGALTRNHVERHHLEKNIDAVLLEGKIARILGVEEKSLGILISAVCQEADRKHVMEYTLSYYPSKRNKFVLKINV
jgi:DNA-binding GntR family transcriptional regulator